MTEDQGAARAPEIAFVYANSVGARGGVFDVSLEFGYVVPPAEGEEPPRPNWQVRVVMSWEHARAMLRLLDDQVRAYEDKVGPIPDIDRLRMEEGKP